MNSGAEAVETAIKAARKWGYTVKGIPTDKAEIIVCAEQLPRAHDHDHQLLDRRAVPRRLRPVHARASRSSRTATPTRSSAAITPNTAAFLVEPIQGEAGIIIPPDGLPEARPRRSASANNVLFIADEIQSGLGRTGKLFAHQWEDIRPDMVIIGKALSGGFYPVSAVLASTRGAGRLQARRPRQHLRRQPAGAARSRARRCRCSIDEKLVERSAELGAYFLGELQTLHEPRSSRRCAAAACGSASSCTAAARPYCERLKEEGILCKETHDHVIRFAPPLVITREEIDWAFERIKKVVDRLTHVTSAVTDGRAQSRDPVIEAYETYPHRHHGRRRARLPQLQRRLPRQRRATTSSPSPRRRSRTSTAASTRRRSPASCTRRASRSSPRRTSSRSSASTRSHEVVFAYSDVPYNYVMDRGVDRQRRRRRLQAARRRSRR